MNEDLIYKIALPMIPHVGDTVAKKLVAYCGGVEAVFKERKGALMKIPFVGKTIASAIAAQNVLGKAELEMEFIEKEKITPIFYLDSAYPRRLLQCDDAPVMLYYKGSSALNMDRVLGVVGTRNATEYGKEVCKKIVEGFDDILVVSGLAYGIDTCAHQSAIEASLPTIGVLGHGLDRIYPAQNRRLAQRMVEDGGLLTEFRSNTNPDRENFPKRNRIVAGMVDALLVVESAKRGGSLITAQVANSYSRDVFAVPGATHQEFSQGCNWLIRSSRAGLVESAEHIKEAMGWESTPKKSVVQRKMFPELTSGEKLLVDALRDKGCLSMDALSAKLKMPTSRVAALLLNLEFEGVVSCLPGKRIKLLD